MKKTDHGKKGKIILVTVVLCCLIAATCAGQWKPEAWARLPEIAKTHFVARDYLGDRTLSIMCFPNTQKALRLFLNKPEGLPIATYTFPDDRSLVVAIKSYGSQFWYPWGLVFTQGASQYPVGFGDIFEVGGSFNGGQLRDGIITYGYIRLPSGLNATKPFRVWFGDQCGTIVMLSAVDD
jgi:hypothetical protein